MFFRETISEETVRQKTHKSPNAMPVDKVMSVVSKKKYSAGNATALAALLAGFANYPDGFAKRVRHLTRQNTRPAQAHAPRGPGRAGGRARGRAQKPAETPRQPRGEHEKGNPQDQVTFSETLTRKTANQKNYSQKTQGRKTDKCALFGHSGDRTISVPRLLSGHTFCP